MNTWEYKVLVVSTSGSTAGNVVKDNDEYPLRKQPQLFEHLNYLGKLGWRLISNYSIGEGEMHYILERPGEPFEEIEV
ncbi:MAG: hypothetical protein JXB38_09280 [Anaerolineales bacterium]|jgi:hypothetical protein|nr:hypothetical protein [Anaerolineales bacterium]